MTSLLTTGSDANGAGSGNATAGTTGAVDFQGTAGAVQHSGAQKIEGIASFLMTGTAFGYLRWNPGTHTSSFTSFYIYIQDIPSTNTGLYMWRNTADSAIIADFRILTTGALQIRDSSNIQRDSFTPSTNTWYRVDWSVNVGSNQQQIKYFTGANLHLTGTSVHDSGLVTYGGGSHGKAYVGVANVTTGTLNVYIDYLHSDDTTMPAPYSPPSPSDSTVYLTTPSAMVFAEDTTNVVEASALRPTASPMLFLTTSVGISPNNSGTSTPAYRWKNWNAVSAQWVDLQFFTWTGSFWAPMDFEDWNTLIWQLMT